jgi:hypothetical protein
VQALVSGVTRFRRKSSRYLLARPGSAGLELWFLMKPLSKSGTIITVNNSDDFVEGLAVA